MGVHNSIIFVVALKYQFIKLKKVCEITFNYYNWILNTCQDNTGKFRGCKIKLKARPQVKNKHKRPIDVKFFSALVASLNILGSNRFWSWYFHQAIISLHSILELCPYKAKSVMFRGQKLIPWWDLGLLIMYNTLWWPQFWSQNVCWIYFIHESLLGKVEARKL